MTKIVYNLVYNRKKRLNKNGTALVQVEAYLNRKRMYFSTNVYLRPEQWDTRRLVVKRHPNAEALNRYIHDIAARIERTELELWQQGRNISLELLRSVVKNNADVHSFSHFFREEVRKAVLKESTRRNHLSTLGLLESFDKDAAFADITFGFVSSFESFLKSKNYHLNTIAKHLRHLKRYVNVAINKGYMDVRQYAFRKYRIRGVESRHTFLLPDELEALERLELTDGNARFRKTLDAFLFCCYAGMRYSDFITLSSHNVMKVNGMTWITYRSVKTRVEVRLPIYLLFSGKAIAILEKYEADLDSFFAIGDNSNVNKRLAVIARLAGLDKRMTFHTARHTNATLLIFNGVNITTVQKLLGHKNVRTTQVYTNIMDMTIVQDLEKSWRK